MWISQKEENPGSRQLRDPRFEIDWQFSGSSGVSNARARRVTHLLVQDQYLIVGNFWEFQEFHCSRSCSSQYATITAIAILAGISNNNRKCSILILFLYPSSLYSQDPGVCQDPGQNKYRRLLPFFRVRKSRRAPGAQTELPKFPQK